MAYKYRLRQVTASDEVCGPDPSTTETTGSRYRTALPGATGSDASNSQQVYADLDFFVDGNMIHVADTTVDRRFSEYFVRHIEMLQQVCKLSLTVLLLILHSEL